MIAPWYALLYVKLDRIACRQGYALAIHGSMSRDLDLVAIPWIDDAESPEKLVEAVRKFVIAKTDVNLKIAPPKIMPHGRISYIIPVGYGENFYFDLSIMPRRKK